MAKIAVFGCGAMGSVYAGLMASAGHEVWAIDAWADHVDAMNRQGLRVEGASGDRVARVSATTDAREVGPCDLVVVATKARDVPAAAAAVPALMGPETTVLTIQNGLGSSDVLAEALGRDRVIAGIAGGFGASMRGPGHAHHNGMEVVRIGELDGPATDRLQRVAAIWAESGFKVEACDDIAALTWEKLICNCTYSGSTALTGLTIGGVMADPDAWSVAKGCGVEAWRVAKASGIRIRIEEPVAYITKFGQAIPNAKPSMLQDHEAKRRAEVDAINGAIPREAAKVGMEAPVNATVAALLRQRERGFA